MTGTSSALQLHDARPFFEKALAHGVQRGIIGAERLAAIHADAPKGMVQIARYFGSEFLRPELEKALQRMVNLISLHLLETSGGDLDQAAMALRDHSLLSRSKGGSDMLRRLIALPESSNFGLAAHGDAEAVIRMGLAAQALGLPDDEWPTAPAFEKRVTALRKKQPAAPAPLRLPPGLPDDLRDAVQAECAAVLADLPRLLDPAVPLRKLLHPLGSFRARYFLLDDPLAEVDDYLHAQDALEEEPRPASTTWTRAVQGNVDEHALLTLFLCLAAGVPKKTLLTEKAAASLVRKIRKTGLHPELATAFIDSHAPGAHRQDYIALWNGFVQDARKTLLSDMDYQMSDALALLRRECSVAA